MWLRGTRISRGDLRELRRRASIVIALVGFHRLPEISEVLGSAGWLAPDRQTVPAGQLQWWFLEGKMKSRHRSRRRGGRVRTGPRRARTQQKQRCEGHEQGCGHSARPDPWT